MRLILMVHSSCSDYNVGCDYAVVDLTPAMVELIRSRAALAYQSARQEPKLDEISFWSGTAEFYSTALADACQEAVAAATGGEEANDAATVWLNELESQGYAVVPQRIDLGKFEAQRTECDRMTVSVPIGKKDCDVSWCAYPKHTDVRVTTWDMPLSAMETLTGAQSPFQQEPPQTIEPILPSETRLPCHGIVVRLHQLPSANEPGSGTISSDLKQDATGGDEEYLAAIDGLESLILAHACAGIDVTSPAYVEGIETAVQAIGNILG